MSTLTSIVTGGAGFIGSHLVKTLLARGEQVICVDNYLTGSKSNIAPFLSHPKFRFIQHDISEPFPASFAIHPQVIYHLASPASPVKYRKYALETMRVNSMGTWRMLEFASLVKATIVLASTSEVYGNPLIHPQTETYAGNVNPIGLRSCYDESKRFAESLTMEFFRNFKTDVRIVRIFNTYGPNMDPQDGRVVSNFITQALGHKDLTLYGDGSQTRSLCYVSDLVDGLVKMAKLPISGEVVNLGNPEELTVRQIAQKIIQLTGSDSRIVSVKSKDRDDPDKRRPDITKAKRLLRWKPVVSVDEGLRKTIDYFRAL